MNCMLFLVENRVLLINVLEDVIGVSFMNTIDKQLQYM